MHFHQKKKPEKQPILEKLLYFCGMRVVIQRVKSAKVHITDYPTAEIGQGLLVLLGVGCDDSKEDVDWLVKKIIALRIFDDDEGVMNRSVMDIGGDIMVVSQFTLMASTKKGNRPSWIHAAPHSLAIPMYDTFCQEMGKALGKPVATGQFGANMQVELTNDGPVTIIMDTKNKT